MGLAGPGGGSRPRFGAAQGGLGNVGSIRGFQELPGLVWSRGHFTPNFHSRRLPTTARAFRLAGVAVLETASVLMHAVRPLPVRASYSCYTVRAVLVGGVQTGAESCWPPVPMSATCPHDELPTPTCCVRPPVGPLTQGLDGRQLDATLGFEVRRCYSTVLLGTYLPPFPSSTS